MPRRTCRPWGRTAEEIREEARDAQKTARDTLERVDMLDRTSQNVIAEVRATTLALEELSALARVAQQDAPRAVPRPARPGTSPRAPSAPPSAADR